MDTRSLSILAIFRYGQTLLFVVEEPRPYTGFEPVITPFERYFTTKLLEDKRLDEGSTTQTWAHIHLYTAPKLLKEVKSSFGTMAIRAGNGAFEVD